jgi:hypothetical protein
LLDKRRFEAVEKIWAAVNDLLPLKNLYAMTAHLNYDALAKRTQDAKIQQFLNMIDNFGQGQQTLKNVARDERPFVPEITWAYFNPFSSLVTFNSARFKALKLGFGESQELINTEYIKNILKAALPHQTQFIDEQDPEAYYYLIEEIENRLLSELRKILDGKEADQSSIQRANEISSAIQKANDAQTKAAATQ